MIKIITLIFVAFLNQSFCAEEEKKSHFMLYSPSGKIDFKKISSRSGFKLEDGSRPKGVLVETNYRNKKFKEFSLSIVLSKYDELDKDLIFHYLKEAKIKKVLKKYNALKPHSESIHKLSLDLSNEN